MAAGWSANRNLRAPVDAGRSSFLFAIRPERHFNGMTTRSHGFSGDVLRDRSASKVVALCCAGQFAKRLEEKGETLSGNVLAAAKRLMTSLTLAGIVKGRGVNLNHCLVQRNPSQCGEITSRSAFWLPARLSSMPLVEGDVVPYLRQRHVARVYCGCEDRRTPGLRNGHRKLHLCKMRIRVLVPGDLTDIVYQFDSEYNSTRRVLSMERVGSRVAARWPRPSVAPMSIQLAAR
jgi:hypothetical protein